MRPCKLSPIKTDDGKLRVIDKQAEVPLFITKKATDALNCIIKNGKLGGRKWHLIRVRIKELCSELTTIKLADYLHVRFRSRWRIFPVSVPIASSVLWNVV